MKVQQAASKARLKRFVGRTLPILVEGPSEESEYLWRGRHQGQAPDIDGHVLIRSGKLSQGKILDLKIERAMEYDLIASAIE